jgi:murein DD-endopeptidase MepM/ murein hydrolase activator NlpD
VQHVKATVFSSAATPRARTRRLAFAGGAVALAFAVAIVSTAPSPAAHSTTLPPQRMLTPQELVAYAGGPAAEHGVQASEDPDHLRANGRVGGDLTVALQEAGVPERIGREFVGLLARAIDLTGGLSVEDKFDLVYEPGSSGRLLFAGLDRVARADLALLKWTDGKQTVWINAEGAWGSEGAMRRPVPGQVTSGFGARFHPILGYARFHRGVDLKAAWGAPIVAAADGRVVAAGWHGGYGRLVQIAHAGGLQTMYGHMSRIVAGAGQLVRQGQVIGYVGSTGLSTGPHLHYEVLKNGRAVNPLSVKMGGPSQLQGEQLHVFHDKLRELLMPQSGGA